MNKVVEFHLIELFKAVADARDGGNELPDDVRDAYDAAFETFEVQKFYGELIEARHNEVFGEH